MTVSDAHHQKTE